MFNSTFTSIANDFEEVCLGDFMYGRCCPKNLDTKVKRKRWAVGGENSSLTHLNRNTQRCVVLDGKHGTFHLYVENLPSMLIPLWLTTVDGA